MFSWQGFGNLLCHKIKPFICWMEPTDSSLCNCITWWSWRQMKAYVQCRRQFKLRFILLHWAWTNVNIRLFVPIKHALWAHAFNFQKCPQYRYRQCYMTKPQLLPALTFKVWQAADRQPRQRQLAAYSPWAQRETAAGPGSSSVTSLLFSINNSPFPPWNIHQTSD